MNIVVCVDLSESTDKIVRKAEEIAGAVSAKLWLLHVAEPDPDFIGYEVGPQSVRDSLSRKFREQHRLLQQIADRVRAGGVDTTALLVQGATVDTILAKSSGLNANMIIVGSHGKGAMYQLLVGSVSEGLLRNGLCPILIVPTHKRT